MFNHVISVPWNTAIKISNFMLRILCDNRKTSVEENPGIKQHKKQQSYLGKNVYLKILCIIGKLYARIVIVFSINHSIISGFYLYFSVFFRFLTTGMCYFYDSAKTRTCDSL